MKLCRLCAVSLFQVKMAFFQNSCIKTDGWTRQICAQALAGSCHQMLYNPIALKMAKIVCNFGLSECSRVKST